MQPTTLSAVGAQWYLVHTKVRQEIRAELNLRGFGLEVVSPKLREKSVPGCPGRYTGVAPLFPGYVFARFDAEQSLNKVRNTRGVHSVVGFGEYATPVEADVIRLIQSRLQPDGFVCRPKLRPGDAIEVIEGPLQSLAGVFECDLRHDDRVQILLTTMHGQRRVQLPSESIRGAEPWPRDR